MSDALRLPPRSKLEEYEKLARDLEQAEESGLPAAVREWARCASESEAQATRFEQRWSKHPKRPDALAAAKLFLAREHGFADWGDFATHVQGLGEHDSAISHFEEAADAIVGGDLARLEKLLRDHPHLTRERSMRAHRSTLLHYVSANGIEDFRQKTPPNILDITTALLEHGADVNAESEAYGGGSTALGLTATSVHPERAGVQLALLQILLDHGATMESPAAADQRHSLIAACLANGQPKAAKFLEKAGAPLDLEGAAALGRLEAVTSYFDQKGALAAKANPNHLQSGLVYAAGYGRTEVVQYLLEKGAHPAWQNGNGQTALHWAAYGAHPAVVRLLLEHGAPVDVRDRHSEATPLDSALYAREQATDPERREHCEIVIDLLKRHL